MSTIYLLKDHEGAMRGDMISVPFTRGKELIRLGVASYTQQLDIPAVAAVQEISPPSLHVAEGFDRHPDFPNPISEAGKFKKKK